MALTVGVKKFKGDTPFAGLASINLRTSALGPVPEKGFKRKAIFLLVADMYSAYFSWMIASSVLLLRMLISGSAGCCSVYKNIFFSFPVLGRISANGMENLPADLSNFLTSKGSSEEELKMKSRFHRILDAGSLNLICRNVLAFSSNLLKRIEGGTPVNVESDPFSIILSLMQTVQKVV